MLVNLTETVQCGKSLKELWREGLDMVGTYFQLYKHVMEAEALRPFYFDILDVTDETVVTLRGGKRATLKKVEPQALQCLQMSLENGQYYGLLACMQTLGFDIFPIASMPKGEICNLVNDNIPVLIASLGRPLQSKQISLLLSLRNKIPSFTSAAKHGRLHVRVYTGSRENQLLLTSHIDPPDMKHLFLRKHLSGAVEVDYPLGIELFFKVLVCVGGELHS